MQETDEKTGQMFTDQLIQDGCFTFMLAGYETTATALPIVFYFMSLVCFLFFLCVSTYFLVYANSGGGSRGTTQQYGGERTLLYREMM